MLTLNDGRSELWQWDTGRELTVDADCSQVHFSNKVFGRSIDVDVADGMAIIPDILLQSDKDLTAWAFVGTAENGYTKISRVFKVNKRNKPADYVFTHPEQTSLEEILKKIDYLESIQDPDAIKNAVDDYLANNPIKVNETDPTVSNWAKEKEKPKYTADEVGALSKTELSGAVNDALAQAKDSGEFKGEPGDDYVLTEADKQEIAELTAPLVDVPEGGAATMQPLTFTGAVNATYDGSEAVTVEIPTGGGGGVMTLLGTYVLTPSDKKITLDMASYDYKNFFVKYTMPVKTAITTDFHVKNAANVGHKLVQITNPFWGYGYYNIIDGVLYGETHVDTGYGAIGDEYVNGLVRNSGADKTSLVLEMYPYIEGAEELTIELWGY